MFRTEEFLETTLKGKFIAGEEMRKHTSFLIGGKADFFVSVEDSRQLSNLLKGCFAYKIPYFILGNGTNLLVSDDGIEGIVIKLLGQFTSIKFLDNTRILAGAGVSLTKLIQKTCQLGLGGLEGLYGIPATVGGAVRMNAGTRYGAIGDMVCFVNLLDREGKSYQLTGEEAGFKYRASNIPEGSVIQEVCLALETSVPEELQTALSRVKSERKNYTFAYGNAGCMFKNPPGNFAGYLIDKSGGKRLQVGEAFVADKHANFILNKGNAKAEHVYRLTEEIKGLVAEKFGVTLEREVKLVGRWKL